MALGKACFYKQIQQNRNEAYKYEKNYSFLTHSLKYEYQFCYRQTAYEILDTTNCISFALCIDRNASDVMVKNLNYPDCKEGIDAFIHKRQPVWKD